jgi:hypothetical protein
MPYLKLGRKEKRAPLTELESNDERSEHPDIKPRPKAWNSSWVTFVKNDICRVVLLVQLRDDCQSRCCRLAEEPHRRGFSPTNRAKFRYLEPWCGTKSLIYHEDLRHGCLGTVVALIVPKYHSAGVR